MDETLALLNAPTSAERLNNLQKTLKTRTLTPVGEDVNNHIHTTFSFSPYSPTAAAWKARQAGLCTAGIMDHDTMMGAREFLTACDWLKVGGTCGMECRVSFEDTKLSGRCLNNPDQDGIAYILLHGVPHHQIETIDAFFAPLREIRNERNRRMVARLCEMLSGTDIRIDFDRDVLPLSEYAYGGTVTERHIASALAHAIEKHVGRGEGLVRFLSATFNKPIGERSAEMLRAVDNPYFHYDMIGWIKAELVPSFYIPAGAECPNVRDVLSLAEQTGSLSAYSYLGDVGDSVTGDKRAQKFEDDYLDELFDTLRDLGFRAVTYMPTRNTPAQIARLREKIRAGGYFEVSGEDINQPRQSFVCQAMRGGGFESLRQSAWAMIAHEREAHGLFSEEAEKEWPDLDTRVAAYADKGKRYVSTDAPV